MSVKNVMLDMETANVQISNAKNKVGRVISIILSIISLIIAIISFFFNWIVGLVFLGVSALFFGISKLSKYATKVNENTINKIQQMKDDEEPSQIN